VIAATTNNLDPDGYDVSVDGSVESTVEVNGSVTVTGIPAGSRTVALDGIASNCAADGAGSQTVSVTVNGTATASFAVTCTDPPDGRIYFGTVSESGAARLSVMNTDGSGVLDLTSRNAGQRIDVSPDGDRIAFDVGPDTGGLELFLAFKDGSGQTKVLSPDDSYEGTPSWSPDGAAIAFTSGPDNFQISAADSDGSNTSELTGHPEHWSLWPDWSPDGSKIAFQRITTLHSYAADARIHVMNADGTGVTALTEAAPQCEAPGREGWPVWQDHFPQWSPDGTQILFARWFNCEEDESDNYMAVFVMNQDGTDPRELVQDASLPHWSPDGTQIAFIKGGDFRGESIAVMNSDGTNQTVIREAQAGGAFIAVAWGGP
jgi:Tol biopolymer transport system component